MIGKDALTKWLRAADAKLKKKVVLVAVGGTAMTLLGLKNSTIDVDFSIGSQDKKEFEAALDKKFKVDIFVDGYIFSEQLPEDYIEKSKEVLVLDKIRLKVLSPADIVITKSARLNARDEEDIKAVAKYVKREELVKRFEQVAGTYSGREENYRENFEYVLRMYFH